jgi:uncharacterized protein
MSDAPVRSLSGREAWKVRRLNFDYAGVHVAPRTWHPNEPEFARFVEALSVSMPYLEPYLIQTIREAKAKIDDPILLREMDLYIGQESAHFRQHQKLNDEIAKTTSHSRPLETMFQADYKAFRETRSEAFHLAYAEGFEALTMAVAQTLVDDRVRLWSGASSAPVSMILWHMVEEIEHKTVTFDVFERLHGGYWMRLYGFAFATVHLLGRGFQGYRKMLAEDGVARDSTSRWRRWRTISRFLGGVLWRAARIANPWYDPRQTKDPAWALAWIARFEQDGAGFRHLDMARLSAPAPALQGD